MTERDVLLAERFHFFVGDLDRGSEELLGDERRYEADRMTTVTIPCTALR